MVNFQSKYDGLIDARRLLPFCWVHQCASSCRYEEVQTTIQTDSVSDIPCGTSGGVVITFDKVRPSFVRSFVRSLARSFVRSFVRSFGRSFVRPYVRSFVRLFVRSPRDLARSRSRVAAVPPQERSHIASFFAPTRSPSHRTRPLRRRWRFRLQVEVVNRLRRELVRDTVANYTTRYDQPWIFDKVKRGVHGIINESRWTFDKA